MRKAEREGGGPLCSMLYVAQVLFFLFTNAFFLLNCLIGLFPVLLFSKLDETYQIAEGEEVIWVS